MLTERQANNCQELMVKNTLCSMNPLPKPHKMESNYLDKIKHWQEVKNARKIQTDDSR